MFLSYLEGRILIEGVDGLKDHQRNQLQLVWGYKRTVNGYEIEPADSELLVKTTTYLSNQSVVFSLDKSAVELLETLRSKKEQFNALRQKSRNYKEGNYDDERLREFVQYLENNSVRTLKTHQVKAAKHLYLVGNGANFSVPGSGKTSVVLSVFEKLRQEERVNLLFVVGPPACFGPWKDEYSHTLGREAKCQILAGGDSNLRKVSYFTENLKNSDLILTSFQTLLKDHKDVLSFLRISGVDIFLVVDEAHYIKKINGNWANVVLDLAKYAKYRCILTGTPMPRSYTDIFNLFDFLWPEDSPIDNTVKIRIQQLEHQGKNTLVKDLLKNCVNPLFYRVKKSDLGLRNAIFHDPVTLEMNSNEKRLYDAIENRILEYSKEDSIKNLEIVKKLRRGRVMRLRQCTSYAKLLSTVIDSYHEDLIGDQSDLPRIINKYDELELPAKIVFLIQFVKNLLENKQKVIVWSNFIGTLKLIRQTLSDNGIKSKIIYGETPIEQQSIIVEETREKIRDEFLDLNSGLNVLIANPAALAESVSLHTTCHSAIYYDLSYNCAQYLQSLDRIHRVGGSEMVDTNYYFLQYKNTIDQDIIENLKQKARKMNEIIEEDLPVFDLNMVEEDENEEAFKRLFKP